MFTKSNRLSLISAVSVFLILTLTTFNLSRWKSHDVIIHDIQSYYSYLPAIFIYDDLSFQYKYAENTPEEVSKNVWYIDLPGGKRVQKMSLGTAVLYAPFFFASHSAASLLGYSTSGYSSTYQFGLAMSSLFYGALGLVMLLVLLRRFASDKAVALTLPLVYLGTNLFFYIVQEGAMSHNYSFFLVSFMGVLCFRWIANPTWIKGLLLGFVLGLLVIVRPINVLLALFFVLLAGFSMKAQTLTIKQLASQLLIIAFAGLLAVLPQLVYWKYATGNWIHYSYGDEGFFFGNPQFIKGLFSFRKGWFIYTPIMAVAFLGLPLLWQQHKRTLAALIATIAPYLFVAFSWWCWWYGGSYGNRALIDVYPLMAIPLALIMERIISQRNWYKWGGMALVCGLLLLNQFQTYQYRKGIIHYDSMSWELYKATFLNPTYPANYDKLVDPPNYDAAKQGVR